MEGVVVSAEDAAQQRVLLDALPYIDREYEDPAVQAMVRSMIEAEMAAMEPRDYLAHLPPPPARPIRRRRRRRRFFFFRLFILFLFLVLFLVPPPRSPPKTVHDPGRDGAAAGAAAAAPGHVAL